jgi:hypothetical protein
MNKWIYAGIFVAGMVIGIAVGFMLCNTLVTKTIVKSYERQAKQQSELVETLVKIPKNMIQNTLTVKRVKKGSSVYYVPSSDLKAIEVKMDSIMQDFTFPEDTVTIPEKTFWERIKFW